MKRILILVLAILPVGAQDPHVVKRRSSPGAGQKQVHRGLRRCKESRGNADLGGPERLPAEGQLLRILGAERQSRLRILFAADAAPIRDAELPDRAVEHPDFLNNFQSQLTADQTLYDAGQTKHAVRSAELTKDIATEEGRRTQMEVIAGVIRAYYDALLSADQLNATNQAMRSAEADLERAQNIRSAGMSTDVDALSIRVHLASVREQQIRREADVDVARAALNDAIGLPLDTPHTLTTPLAPLSCFPKDRWRISRRARSSSGRRRAR